MLSGRSGAKYLLKLGLANDQPPVIDHNIRGSMTDVVNDEAHIFFIKVPRREGHEGQVENEFHGLSKSVS